MGYDIIGDIHGQYEKLEALLRCLGYLKHSFGWVPPQGRQAIFLGDLIDRGPSQMKVVSTVRSMIDDGHARSVMGNHEFNAIGYATPSNSTPGEFLRSHTVKNLAQHAEFLRQVGEGSALHRELVAWFKTLPPSLDLGVVRVVHAWWHQPYVDLVASQLRTAGGMDDDFLYRAHRKGSPESLAMEGLTKGLEIDLPSGHSFFDHGGVERHEVRTKWWHPNPRTYRDVAILDADQHASIPDHPLLASFRPAPVTGTPIFIGHYWMKGEPKPQSPKVACVDYSAAKNGPLVAYRWDGEDELQESKFVAAG